MRRGLKLAFSSAVRSNIKIQKRHYASITDETEGPGGIVATVFGASGFTGRYVVEALTQVGAQVIIPYRSEERDFQHLKVMGELGQVVPVRFDLKDRASIERMVTLSNVVINLIGREYETRNFSYEDVNYTGAKNIAEACKHVDRYVHVGAACVSKDSKSVWSQTKARGQEAVREILPFATIMKPTIIYGDEDRLFNKWGNLSSWFPFIVPYSSGDAKIQPLHSHDLSKAIVAALGESDSIGKDYVLAGNEVFTWRDIITNIVNEGTRRDKKLVELPHYWMEKLAFLFEQDFRPIMTRDQLHHFATDLVMHPGDLGLKDLGIQTNSLKVNLLRIARLYRPHDKFHDVIDQRVVQKTKPLF